MQTVNSGLLPMPHMCAQILPTALDSHFLACLQTHLHVRQFAFELCSQMHRPHQQSRLASFCCLFNCSYGHRIAVVHVLVQPHQLLRLVQQPEVLLRDEPQQLRARPCSLCAGP